MNSSKRMNFCATLAALFVFSGCGSDLFPGELGLLLTPKSSPTPSPMISPTISPAPSPDPSPLPSPSVSPTPPHITGSVTSSNILNTLTLSWNKATSNVFDQEDLTYEVYFSRTNNISTLEDALANGRVIASGDDYNTVSIPGLSNNITYYYTVVVMDELENRTAYPSGSAMTGVGPTLSSFTTNNGVPSVVGTDLNLIWAGSWVNYFHPNEETADCLDLGATGGGTNLNYYFGSSGQTSTSWNPGNDGALHNGQYLPGLCISLCSDSDATPNSVCTPGYRVTATSS